VCVKRILPHLAQAPDFASMFRDEAAIAARLQHQNIVQIFDFGDEGGSLYIAMEFVDGVSLARILQTYSHRGERLPLASVLKIGVDICKGLHHAHTATGAKGKPLGLVHRDVTPHNILVSKAGEVKVADFGVARAEGRRTHTQSGVVKGKMHYMAPEQALGLPFDHRLDQFAAGIVLWESLTGRRLFKGKSDFLVLEAVTRVDIPSATDMRNDVPPRLNAIVRRALEKDPEKRFPDMAALGNALDEVLFATAKNAAALDLKPIVMRTLDRNARSMNAPVTVSVSAPELAKSNDEPFDDPTAAMLKAEGTSSSGVWAADGDDARNRIDDPTDNVDNMRTASDARGRIGARPSSLSSEAHGEPRTGASSNRAAP
jgi:eukaryotic-like serine/threonine-protein kinase